MTSRSDRNYVPLNEEEQKIMDRAREAEIEAFKSGELTNASRNAYQRIMGKRKQERYANRSTIEKTLDYIVLPIFYPLFRFREWFDQASDASLLKTFALTLVIVVCFIIYVCTGS
jgi:hypothetical protein